MQRVKKRGTALSIGRFALPGALFLGMVANAAVGVGVTDAQDGTDAPETAALVPEDAAAYVAVELDLESGQWAQAQELLTRAGFPDALTELREGILPELGVGNDGSVPADDPFFGGELGVVVSDDAIADLLSASLMPMAVGTTTDVLAAATPTTTGSGGVVAILEPGDPDAAFTVAQERLSEGDDAPVELEETTYAGVSILSTPEDEISDPSALARVDDFILLAATAADLEPIIDTAQGDGPALADFAPLADVRAELTDENLLFAFVNGGIVSDAYPAALREQIEAFAPALADSDAQRAFMGVTLSADDPGFRIDSIQMAPEGGTLDDLLPDTGFEITSDERVPDDSFVYLAGADIGVNGGLAGVAPVLAMAINEGIGLATPGATPTDPADLEPTDFEADLAQAEETLGFNLQDDLLGQLVGEFAFAVSLPGLGGGNAVDLPLIVASGTDDEATVADSLQKLARVIEARGGGLDVSTRSIGEDRVFVLRDPDAAAVPEFEFGVVDGEAVLGTRSGIDEYVDGSASPLADDERYRRTLETLEGDAPFQIVYVDLSQVAPFLADFAGATGGGSGITDADPACAEFDDMNAAQEAFDADPVGQAALDQDFDGEACEDFYATGTPVATPTIAGPEAIEAFAGITYERDGMVASSAILAITEP